MPPAKKRLRGYDHAKTRTAVLAQIGHLRQALDGLTAEQLAQPAPPAGPGDRTVRELAARLTMTVEDVSRAIEAPEPAGPVVALLDWPFATADLAVAVPDETGVLASSAELAEQFARAAERIATLLPGAADGRLLATRVGAMRLGDHLVTRTVELIVHTDDLNRALGLVVPYDRQALAACTRLLADALAVKAPGASTEVRIPPYAVVQCVAGPRHTRGTPPNVVETDPLTWFRLATGRTSWPDALEAAQVSASGERADLSGLLPLMG